MTMWRSTCGLTWRARRSRNPPTTDAATDMSAMTPTHAEVAALRRRVEQAAAAGETTSATRGRGLGGFIEAWREYEQYLERRGGR